MGFQLYEELDRKIKTLDVLMDREDKFFSNRINFFLLIQSMFLLSYVSSFCFDDKCKFIGIIISIFALIITCYFFIIFRRTKNYLEYLREELKLADKVYELILENSKFIYSDNKKRRANWLLGIGLPWLFFSIWLIILFISIKVPFMVSLIFLILYLIIIIFYLNCQLDYQDMENQEKQ